MAKFGQFTCYAPGCAKKSPIDLGVAGSSVNYRSICDSCGQEWAVSFKSRTCCSIYLLFVSVETSGKKSLSKIQSFKVK